MIKDGDRVAVGISGKDSVQYYTPYTFIKNLACQI